MDASWLGDQRDVVVVDGPDAATYLQSQASQDLRGHGCRRVALDVLAATDRPGRRARPGDHDRRRRPFGSTPIAASVRSLEARLNRFKIRVKATVATVDGDGLDPGQRRRSHRRRLALDGCRDRSRRDDPCRDRSRQLAVSFTKGCYPGQELVERMDSRGSTAPRHLAVLPRRPDDTPGAAVLRDGARDRPDHVGRSHASARLRQAWNRRPGARLMVAAKTLAKNLERMRSHRTGVAGGDRGDHVGHRHQLPGAQEDLRVPGPGWQRDGEGRS